MAPCLAPTRQDAWHKSLRLNLRLLQLRCLSAIAPARSIAEAVLRTSMLRALRGREVDIDSTACSLHDSKPPDKRTEAMQFMEPLTTRIVGLIASLQPAKQERMSLRKIASLAPQALR